MKFSPNLKKQFKLDNNLTKQEIFIKFLYHHKIYRKFLNNLERHGVGINKLFNSTEPSNYMFIAFPYSQTKEGFIFWGKVNEFWKYQVNKPNWVRFYGNKERV